VVQKKVPMLIANKIVSIAVLLLNYFCNQFVALEIRHSTEASLQDLSTINMVFSDKDVISTKSLYLKRYIAKRFTDEFPEKGWTKHDVNKLLKKLWDTGTVDRRPGSCRPRSARTEENVETVNDLVSSQEDKPQTHRTVCEISQETGIHRSSVSWIICKDLHLKCFKRSRAQELTDANFDARTKLAKLLLQKFL